MKVGIFDPYLDTLGGGEKYIFEIASCLAKKHQVYLFWDDNLIFDKAHERFGLNLSNIKLAKNIFSKKTNFLKRTLKTRDYNLIIFLSDGSIPFLLSKKNILLFQFPVNWVDGKNLLTRIKLMRIAKIICYSNFVKNFLDKTFPIKSAILTPPVDSPKYKKFKKENIILSVGRFTKAINTKKQEFLIDIFKKICDLEFFEWRLVLIGSVLPKDKDFVETLKRRAEGYPIDVLPNVSFKKLREFYKKAKIYWHAAGFGEDLEKHPERAEHFGISTVEAMGAGAVPVVINAGAQPEIVENGISGFLFKTEDELITKTILLTQNEKLWEKISCEATKRVKLFSRKEFCKKVNSLLT